MELNLDLELVSSPAMPPVSNAYIFRREEMRFFQICSFLNMLNHLDIFCNHLVFTCSSPYISMVCMYVIFIYSRCLQIYIFKIII